MDRNIRKRLQKTFSHMKERCYDESDKRYADWGGRGIGICPEWLENPESFIEWSVAHGYEIGLTIDRIDNDKDYSPDNCRWVTLAENNQNRRSSRFYTFNGKTMNLTQWCKEYQMSRSMVNKRLEMGWDFEKAITTPKRQRNTQELVGMKFGRLTVLEYSGFNHSNNRNTDYLCQCDCGNTVIVPANKLKSGHTKSCGCIQKEIASKTIKKARECIKTHAKKK